MTWTARNPAWFQSAVSTASVLGRDAVPEAEGSDSVGRAHSSESHETSPANLLLIALVDQSSYLGVHPRGTAASFSLLIDLNLNNFIS